MTEKEASTSMRSAWSVALAASALSFLTYFCMYAFRKPFAAGSFAGDLWLGLEPKTVFVLGQVVGYTLSKYLGIRWVSEMQRGARLPTLLGLIAASELALVGFAILPSEVRVVGIFCNGLPLGMIWSLVVRYLEGRRTSEVSLAVLSCSFIVASGVMKDAGRWVLRQGVEEYWMPAVTGAAFFLPLALSAWLLDRLPEPNTSDVAEREARLPMGAAQRRAFARQYLPGLAGLLLVYLGLTAFRDFRDNYGVELFRELGYEAEPSLFSATELSVALGVLVAMAGLSLFRSREGGLVAVFGLMTLGLCLIGASTLALQAGWLGGQGWMVGIGLGAYLAYVPFSSFLFDRLMAATHFAGTAVFAVNLADAVGYTGSVAMQLYKDWFAANSTRLEFFIGLSYALSALGAALLALTGAYFLRRASSAAARG